ncbi:MAG: endo-1,4-beta-D-glucanase Y [Hyphomicrobiaceae bacterium]
MTGIRNAAVGRAALALCVAALTSGAAVPAAATTNQPFASHPMAYAAGSVVPNHVSQAALDQAVRDFYDDWKAEYLEQGCGLGRVYVRSAIDGSNLTVSEAHGYGMMILALMAGHDPDAQTLFDGMVAYFGDHPTVTHDNLMAWNQTKSCADSQGADSASDGDLDIAYALLLAAKQWGSCASVDYASKATAVISDIKDGDLDTTANYVLLGDWVTPDDTTYYPSTRTSDFLTGHYRSFADATADAAWLGLIDTTYDIVATMQSTAAPATGLLPDFVLDPLGSPVPAGPGFLEGNNDGFYSYNAARDPWRLGTDFLISDEARARTAVAAINAFARSTTSNDPSGFRAGYELDGTPIAGSDFLSMAFVAPLGVSAMVDATNQAWLNDIWDLVVATPVEAESYFENTLKLLSMIVMSRNWWAPEAVADGTCSPTGNDLCINPSAQVSGLIKLKRLNRDPGLQSLIIKTTVGFLGALPASFENGMQLRIEDLGAGSTSVYELSEDTVAIPPVAAAVCDSRDRWRVGSGKLVYKNKSGSLAPPECTLGSAQGLSKVIVRGVGEPEMRVLLKTRRSSISAPVGPIRATLVFGATAAAGTAGECAVSGSLDCTGNAATLKCR